MELAFKMGHPVKDKLTGFSGRVTGFTTYITGCDQYLVQPELKDGKDFVDAKWFDVSRLEVHADGTAIELFDTAPSNSNDSYGQRRAFGAGDAAPIK